MPIHELEVARVAVEAQVAVEEAQEAVEEAASVMTSVQYPHHKPSTQVLVLAIHHSCA